MKDILYHFEPDDGTGDDGGTGGGDDDDTSTDDAAALTPEEIKAIRDENARLKATAAKGRTEAARRAKAEADAARKQAEKDGDLAKLQEQLAAADQRAMAAEQKLQQQQARGIAKDLGAVDPPVVVGLIDWNTIADPEDENEVRQAVRAVLKDKPYLRGTTKDPDAGKRGGGEGRPGEGTDMNAVLRRAAGHR